jgi:hypothetical protein
MDCQAGSTVRAVCGQLHPSLQLAAAVGGRLVIIGGICFAVALCDIRVITNVRIRPAVAAGRVC